MIMGGNPQKENKNLEFKISNEVKSKFEFAN